VRPASNAGIFQIAAAEARVTDRLLTAEFAEHLGLVACFASARPAPYRWVMPWFDLFMMRKQFLNLKKRAEKTAAAASL